MSYALFFRLRESSNPRPKGHIEMGSTLTTNWASSSVGSESAPHFNMSLWSWVRALTEAKEKGMGHAPIACEWDHPSSEWAKGCGPYRARRRLILFFFITNTRITDAPCVINLSLSMAIAIMTIKSISCRRNPTILLRMDNFRPSSNLSCHIIISKTG